MAWAQEAETVEVEVRIAARPETVFAFFTDPEKMIQWHGIEATLEPHPGGTYRVNINGRNVARGEYREVVPFSRVVFTWGWKGAESPLPPGSSTVEVSLVPDGSGTIVRVRHTGLPVDLQARHREGWEHFLVRLAGAAEGRPIGPDAWASEQTQ